MGVLPDNPITEKVHTTPFQGTSNVMVAYPAFGDWVRLYDARKLRDIKHNHELFVDMRRNHERTVTEQLNAIVKRATGRAVLAEIGSNTAYSVMLVPFDFLPSDSWSVGTGAVTKAMKERGAALVDVPMSGQTYEGKRYSSETIGKGTGSGSYIYFTARRHNGRETPDEVLLHEMLHASRKVRGVVYRMPVRPRSASRPWKRRSPANGRSRSRPPSGWNRRSAFRCVSPMPNPRPRRTISHRKNSGPTPAARCRGSRAPT